MTRAASLGDSPLAAAILAGGLGRRMGGANKAALRVGGLAIVDRQIERLSRVADPVFVVSSRPDAAAPRAGVRVVPDALPGTGPLGGIYTAIIASPSPRTLVVACDMPFLTDAFLERLAQPSPADVVLARSPRGSEPLCATWSRESTAAIRARLDRGALKAADVLSDLRVEIIGPEALAACDPDGLLFVNVNTPHDYERARALSGEPAR